MDDLFDVFDEKPTEDGLTSLAEGATTGSAAKKRKTEDGEQNSTDSVEQVSKVIEDDELRDAARPPALPASGPASGAGEGGQPAMASSSSSSSSAASSTAVAIGSTTSTDADEAGTSGASALSKGDVDEGKTTALDDRLPDNPARKYPFSLDPFQRRSIACLERNESVMVSAHTSAGKTVVAEYAIAMALRDGQRVIYTSPIKALSNQKYREMVEEFKDVGLMTGDVTIAPQAACLVMTTEILRSMLYRGSEVIKAVKWVIFDEIHYMRDKERGVVWEESIIMLPDTVRFVFLSATIPNAKEFAAWTRHLHHHTCHVVYTDYRPTPLQHFIFPAGGEGVYLVVDEKGRFRSDNFEQAMARLKTSAIEDAVEASEGAGGRKRKRKPQGGKNGTPDLQRLIRMVMQRGYDPVIVFSFSKRDCEKYALQLARLDFTTDEEKQLTERVFKAAISALSEDDRALPQIEALLPLLKRGVGIHHGGLLPILKEVVEILFQESLVKILFATETFAMGVNMPAKTVIFTGLRKFDGNSFRLIRPGEYIQMSGRAGRRGLDDRGIVIQMVDEAMEPEGAKEILRGQADPLDSSFHLSYNMLLNLMRVEAAGVDPESIMQQSFHQFQNERAVPEMERALAVKHKEAGEVEVQEESETRHFHMLCERLEDKRGLMRDMAMQPSRTVRFLAPGRLVRVRDGATDWGWGVVSEVEAREGAFLRERERRLAMGEGEVEGAGGSGAGAGAATGQSSKKDKKKRKKDKKNKGKGGNKAGGGGGDVSLADLPASDVVVKAVLLTMDDSRHLAAKLGAGTVDGTEEEGKARRGEGAPQPCSKKAARAGEGRPRVLPVLLSAVEALSKVRVYLTGGKAGLAEGKGGKPGKELTQVGEKLTEVLRRFDGAPPLLDPRKDLGLGGEPAFEAVYEEAAGVEGQLRDCAAMHWSKADRRERVAALKRKDALVEQTRFLERQIRSSKALVMRDTLRKMKRVLRRLDYVDDKGVVQLKGRVACEVNTADELLVTELIFSGTFSELDEGQVASLLSCAVFGEGSSTDAMEDAELPPRLAGPVRTLREAARRIGDVSAESLIEIDVEEYVKSFRVDMMPVVDAWAAGKKFKEVMKLTKLFEGSVIRVIRRLEELLRQLAEAARGVGEEALEAKFKGASAKMRRDIVFAASLYV